MFPLTEEFLETHQRINLGDRRRIAIAAHFEVRSILQTDPALRSRELSDVLIGSYARRVSIYPGKDVDVFGRLLAHTIDSITPTDAYALFRTALAAYARADRLTEQPRSLKVDFGPDRVPSETSIQAAGREYEWAKVDVDRLVANAAEVAFEFSVDVVPAVAWGDHYGIPELSISPEGTRIMAGTWQQTNPVELTEQTRQRNQEPEIGGLGAFVRCVKTIKQIKSHHLSDVKPSSLFYEFILHEGFENGAIDGDSWAEITASTLDFIARRMGTVTTQPVCDPVLGIPYQPLPTDGSLETCRHLFDDLGAKAAFAASTTDRCQAAINWRTIFGANPKHSVLFPLPPGCRGSGVAQGAVGTNLSSGGTEERSFGRE